MKPLLIVFNPRAIDEAIESIGALNIDIAWLRGFTEPGLQPEIAAVVDAAANDGYTHIVALSDDCVVEQAALDAVLGLTETLDDEAGETLQACVTGYCLLDKTGDNRINLSTEPLPYTDIQTLDDFPTLLTLDDVKPIMRSTFAGMALTSMPVELWQRFPFQVNSLGFGSDYRLSLRLQHAGIPIFAPSGGYIEHLKERWSKLDKAPGAALCIGDMPNEILFSRARVEVEA